MAPGPHVLQPAVVHPDTLGVIPGSQGPARGVVVVPEFARRDAGGGGGGGGDGFVSVEIAVNGQSQALRVARASDFGAEARRFCSGVGVDASGIDACAGHVEGKLRAAATQ